MPTPPPTGLVTEVTRSVPRARTGWSARLYTWRWRLFALWVLLLVAGGALAADLGPHLRGGGWLLAGSETERVDRLLFRTFQWDAARTDMAVFSDSRAVYTDPAFQTEVMARLDRLSHASGVTQVHTYYTSGDRHFASRDGHTLYALVSYSGTDAEIERRIPAYRQLLAGKGSVEAKLTGAAAFNHDIDQASQSDLRRVEVVTLPVVFVLLLFVFGSPLAALLPVVLGGATVSLAMGILSLVARADALSTFAPNTASMLGLGLGIDFSLLFVSRFREELVGHDVPAAVTRTLSTAGRSILYSGLTLAAGMGVALACANVMLLKSLATAILAVTATSVGSALILLPALLSVIGRRIGRIPRGEGDRAGDLWDRWSRLVMRHPWVWGGLALGLSLSLAFPALHMKRGFPELKSISPGYDSYQGFSRAIAAYGPGELNPVFATVRTAPNGLWSSAFRRELIAWQARLEADPRVARVDSWPAMVGPQRFLSLSPFGLNFDPMSRTKSAVWANVGRGDDVTVLRIMPKKSDRDPEVQQLVRDLRADRAHHLLGGTAQEVLFGGNPGNAVDFDAGIYDRFPVMSLGIVALTFAVLLVFLRSFWLPVKAVAMTCLSVFASYGVLVLVFQHGVGASLIGLDPPGHLTAIVPFLLFGALFGLSTDYEVFLLTRIREWHLDGASDEEAVSRGLTATGRVISAAAIVMVAVFMTFAMSSVTVIKEIGLGLAMGVLLDATLIRIVLVPATMRLMGRWNWWLPGWIDRRLPRIAHEGVHEPRSTVSSPRRSPGR